MRVAEFGRAAPNCCCELQTTSPHSPGTVTNAEQLTRFIFSPIHVHKKTGAVLSSAFSHVSTKGCSVQREALASSIEIETWIQTYLIKNVNHRWMGTLTCSSKTVREISLNNSINRMAAVYDTAEPKNQAHAEIFQTEHVIDDADKLELKFELFTKFSNGHLTKPDSYRGGDLALRLNSNHQSQIA